MKNKLMLVFLFAFSLLLFSCSKDSYIMCEVNQETILYNQTIDVLDYETVLKKLNKYCNMNDFCQYFEINEYKVIGQTSYVIINTTNGLILVQFDLQGNYVANQQIEFSPIHCENSINNIKIGMSLDDVKLADPTKKFDFLLHSSSKYPQMSYHFFEDGKAYYFYFENYIVKNIVVFTI